VPGLLPLTGNSISVNNNNNNKWKNLKTDLAGI
jgi:hypothetical protein